MPNEIHYYPILFFWKHLYWKGRTTGGGTDWEIEIFHQRVQLPRWLPTAGAEPDGRRKPGIPPGSFTGVARAQWFGPLFADFSGALARSWTKSGAAGIWNCTPSWGAGSEGSSFKCCVLQHKVSHTILPIAISVLDNISRINGKRRWHWWKKKRKKKKECPLNCSSNPRSHVELFKTVSKSC